MRIYHGSPHIIEKPIYGKGKPYNDYGLGFYCTENIELAKEWACSETSDGYANTYKININDMNVLNLNNASYNILKSKRDSEARKAYLTSNRKPSYSADELYILDIMRQGVKNHDSRLR